MRRGVAAQLAPAGGGLFVAVLPAAATPLAGLSSVVVDLPVRLLLARAGLPAA